MIVPLFDRELARDQRGARAVAVVDDLEQVPAFGLADGEEAPVIEDEEIGTSDTSE